MAILPLVHHTDPILKKVAEPFDFKNPPADPAQIAIDLTETMIANKGLGLAANQVGLPYRVFVLTGETVYACFNPKIVSFSEEETYMNEGCLSYPGMVVKIKRPSEIRVRFTLPNGNVVTTKLAGLSARCFMHELDHLDGVVHLNRATLYHRQQAWKTHKAYMKIQKKTDTSKLTNAINSILPGKLKTEADVKKVVETLEEMGL